MASPFVRRPSHRLGPERGDPPRAESVAVEEPLQIRLDCNIVAVTMRTPGADDLLALGFLHAEGVLRRAADVADVVVAEGEGTVNVLPAPDAVLPLTEMLATRRGTLVSAACGVCGRDTIDDLLARCGRLPAGLVLAPTRLLEMVASLRQRQAVFAATGGVHAAAAFRADGTLLACFEDVGRHNAVDKVVGWLLREGRLDAADSERAAVLVVSGRAGFEIVQKAIAARIPILASVSAPSSLAVDLAQASDLTLVGFARGESAEVYAAPERLRLA